jgi:hypothetical protein
MGQIREPADRAAATGPQPRALRDLIWLAVLRLAISAALGFQGVHALSDDDYARVTIAQRFARAARFDPSGTSWLPFPFWVTGAVMKVVDPSLAVARLVAALLSVGSTWLLFAAGRMWGLSKQRAFFAAAFASLVPAVAMLGSVTVPELPTAALGVFALVAVTAPSPPRDPDRPPLYAGAAMLAATLSRYEAWPIAAAIAGIVWLRQKNDRPWKRAALAALPIAGPVIWVVHNRIAHGNALSFLQRVSSYRAALGSESGSHPFTYVVGLVGGSPAVMLALLLVIVASRRSPRREAVVQGLRRYRGWIGASAALLAFLLAGQLFGGAPTHHPERALLVVWLLAVLATVDLATLVRPPIWFALPVALLLLLDYRSVWADRGVNREVEERVGEQLFALVPRGDRVFVATTDYGYFAVMAAFGRPSDVALDSLDPRSKSGTRLLRDPWNAVVRLRAENASWLVAPSSITFPLALQERMRDGSLVIYELDPRR